MAAPSTIAFLFDGLNYSSFAVNPPDPSGYIPNNLIMCMNDRGSGVAPDPFYQAAYSQFCYVWSFMPGQTSYLDTPVIPTSAFAAEYNHPDCAYPDATPAISEVDGDGVGPWVSAVNHTITIHALGDQKVNNYGYSGPAATTAPWNQKTVTRHYGFGATAGTVALVATNPAGNTVTIPPSSSKRNTEAKARREWGPRFAVNWSSRPLTAKDRSTP